MPMLTFTLSLSRAFLPIDSASILAKLKSSIANFKVPRRLHVIDQLPRNTMGEVQKNILRDTYKREGW